MTIKEIKIREIPLPPVGDLSDFKVLTPHRGAADHLGVPHHSLHQIAGNILKSRGYETASAPDSARILAGVISDLQPESDGYSSASAIMLILQTVLRTGLDLEKLETYGSEKVKRIARIAREYQFRLRKKGLADPEEILFFASQLPVTPRKLLIYGYHRARAEEINLIAKLAGEGSVMYLPAGADPVFRTNRREIESLVENGWVVSEEIAADETAAGEKSSGRYLAQKFTGGTEESSNAEISATEYPDIEVEIRAVLTRVKTLVNSGVSPKKIVIVSRDASIYGQAALRVAWEYGISVQMMYRTALGETLFGAWMNILIGCLENGFPFESAVRLFNHPLGADLPETVWEKARRRHPQTLGDWLQIGADVKEMVLPEEAARREWAKRLFSILDKTGARRKAGIRARELIAFQTFQAEMKKSAEDQDAVITRREFIGEMSILLNVLKVPFHPASGGIEFHEPHTLLGAEYDHVFVLGMAEGILPGSVSDNPVVDFYERRQLAKFGIKFEDAADVTRWESLSFYFLLLVAGGEIHFSYPRLIKNAEQLPSLFFARLGLNIKKAVESSLSVSSLEEHRRLLVRRDDFTDEIADQIRRAINTEKIRESAAPFGEYDGVVGIPLDPYSVTWSASQLTAIGQCPFRWFASKVLKLNKPPASETELTALTRGKLYHRTLELAVKAAGNCEDVRAAALNNLEAAFEAAETDPEIAAVNLTAWEAQRLEHVDVLRRAIEAADFIAPDAIIKETEFSFESEWCGLKLKGQIDRIDILPDGNLSVVDYKTGGSAPPGVKDEDGKLKIDIQLPVYIKTAASSSAAKMPGGQSADDSSTKPAAHTAEEASGYYYSISKAKILKRFSGDQLQTAHDFAEKVKKQLLDGSYPVEPDEDKNACTYCDYDAVCRKGYRLIRKKNI